MSWKALLSVGVLFLGNEGLTLECMHRGQDVCLICMCLENEAAQLHQHQKQ